MELSGLSIRASPAGNAVQEETSARAELARIERFQAMSEPTSKTFDCVQSAREIRDRLSAEIADMSYDELSQWLGAHRYSDPFLQRLAEKAAQADAEDDASRRR